MTEFLSASWEVMLELSPWMLLGSLIAALLHAFIPSSLIKKQFHGTMGVFKAVILGVPLPLCSCGVIPAGLGLKKDGASDASTVGFLISTPQTGVDSLLVSASFLGWPFAIFKLGAAFITGIVGGLICTLFPEPSAPSKPACGNQAAAKPQPSFKESVDHGMDIIQSIWRWLAIGVAVSAAIQVWLPTSWLSTLGSTHPTAIHGLILVMSIPLRLRDRFCTHCRRTGRRRVTAGSCARISNGWTRDERYNLGAVFKGIGKRAGIIYFTTLCGQPPSRLFMTTT